MEENSIKLAPPWVQYVNALRAIFREDREVHIEYDNDSCVVRLRVDSKTKADALTQLLQEKVEFGNIVLSVIVTPANLNATKDDLFRHAFSGNSAVKEFIQLDGVFMNPVTYMVFKKKVIQYYNDNLGDPHGNRSTLYQEIASEIFRDHDGVLFCTDNEED